MKNLAHANKIGLDVNIILYYLHKDKSFGRQSLRLLAAIKNKIKVISTLVYTEAFVYLFAENNQPLIKAQSKIIETIPKVRIISPTKQICLLAAQLRAGYKLKTPDAIHLATAIDSGCDCFITNDDRLKKVAEIKILTLRDLL